MKITKYKYGPTDVTLYLNPGAILSDSEFQSQIIDKIEYINEKGIDCEFNGKLSVISYLTSNGLTACQVDDIKITGTR